MRVNNFWEKLPRPFFMLAPMYDVTDEAFRQMFVRYGQPSDERGRPDVFFTEFVSVDGLLSEAGRPKLLRELYFEPNERPIVAQVFGADPGKFGEAAKLIQDLGFDGLDINMGCPDRAVIKQGAGGALIKKPALAREILKAAKAGAGTMPVSVKTRIGFAAGAEMKQWLGEILAEKPALLTVHLRTVKEMSKVAAHWELAAEIVRLAEEHHVPIALNGDISSLAEARRKAERYNLDGVMIGRGAFGNPWFFSGYEASPREKLLALKDHIALFADLYLAGENNEKKFGGHTKNFAVMKKHFKAYINGWPKAATWRAELMSADDPASVTAKIDQVLRGIDEQR